MPVLYVDLVSHVLTPTGYAMVSSFVQLVPDEEAEIIADDDTGAAYSYGTQSFPKEERLNPSADSTLRTPFVKRARYGRHFQGDE